MTEQRFSIMKGRPVIFGEVLFDSFPDGCEVLGGAPFNVARHLQGFGQEPLFISRIGDDRRGGQVRAAMAEWGMDTVGLQRDAQHPTGSVRIAMQGTQHTFDILPQQAYDYIDAELALRLLQQNPVSLLYFGSLIEREPVSRHTLQQLRTLPVPLFSDVNLRAPWWHPEGVVSLLQGVNWVKLNDEEIAALGFSGELESAARKMRDKFDLELLVVTRGEAGALFVTAEQVLHGKPVAVKHLIDTVGAGDGFTAVVLLGMLRGWPLQKTLGHALEFAAHLCEVRGAVLPDNRYYEACLAKWES
jgi:fructokinase